MDIKDIIKNGENKTVEFKEIIPNSKKISQTAVAFANGAGGKIFIGITDNREIIGIDENLDIFKTIDSLNIPNDANLKLEENSSCKKNTSINTKKLTDLEDLDDI